MFGIGFQELLIIFAVAFIFFGGKSIPKLGKGIGEGFRELRKAITEGHELEKELKDK